MRALALVLVSSWIPIGAAQVQAQTTTQIPAQAPAQTAVPSPAPAQPATEPQLSPQAAYDQATRPLDIIRRSPQNWSPVELDALKMARAEANTACAARNPDQLKGEDLLAMAHLCAFGQSWKPVLQSATNYLNAALSLPLPTDPKALSDLSMAFDYKVQASLKFDDPDTAFQTAQTMLTMVPYDEFASEATNSTLRYLEFIRTGDALMLLTQRQPIVLVQIKELGIAPEAAPPTSVPSPTSVGAIQTAASATQPSASEPSSMQLAGTQAQPAAPPSKPTLPLYVLYSDAIAFPWMQQFANKPADAAASYSQLEAAVPQNHSSEDEMFMAERRRQYLLLGTHLPRLTVEASLSADRQPPDINNLFPNATVFLLFPDLCNQCVTMGMDTPPRAEEILKNFHARLYPLIAQANPPDNRSTAPLREIPLPPSKTGKGAPEHRGRPHVDQQLTVGADPDTRLGGTPTLVVPSDTLDAFAATDFPLLIGVDHNGIIRTIELAPDDALAPGGIIDQLAQHIVATWPPD